MQMMSLTRCLSSPKRAEARLGVLRQLMRTRKMITLLMWVFGDDTEGDYAIEVAINTSTVEAARILWDKFASDANIQMRSERP